MTGATDRLHPSLLYHVLNTLGWPELRPLQGAAVAPILDGHDALLLAPTAGGKTEAAAFPLLSAMASEGWTGLSVLYVCPLRALLNNLEPRLSAYCSWIGRRCGLWHGDVGDGPRRRLLADLPDLLLTTPESLEAMLVSTRVDPRHMFAGVRAVVVDEIHAFAGDDRGWHLLAVLERLTRFTSRPIQRIGLSATVGNPSELLRWMQGSNAGSRAPAVIAPPATAAGRPDITLDHVGSVENAATVLSALHRGEKRLVFCDSRRRVEELTAALRTRHVQTFASHSSLSADERRRSEHAFAEAADCVIVATSTLELGIDVGNLDRVVLLDAPGTVASFLQRLGRSGRRAGATPNCLILSTDHDALLRAAGLLRLWSTGWVEPVVPPPSPHHIVAQQVLALVLQEGQVGRRTWNEWLGGIGLLDGTEDAVIAHLVERGFLDVDQDMLLIGPRAEKTFGRRHFMELTSVFASDPQFTALHGRTEIGGVAPLSLAAPSEGPRVLLLGGRSWMVTHIDWARHRCYVEASTLPGRSSWAGTSRPLHFRLCRAMRDVALGEDPDGGVALSRRATAALDRVRDELRDRVDDSGTVVARDPGGGLRWWTWAGGAANATLAAALGDAVDAPPRIADLSLHLRIGTDANDFTRSLARARGASLPPPVVSDQALRGLKFAEALPDALAARSLGDRLGDGEGALEVLSEPQRI